MAALSRTQNRQAARPTALHGGSRGSPRGADGAPLTKPHQSWRATPAGAGSQCPASDVRRRRVVRWHSADGKRCSAPPHSRARPSADPVCSTGGPAALAQLLAALGPAFPLPILLVQHVPASYLAGFASWLESICPFSSAVVSHGEIPTLGTV
ncbi:MAG: hypothetical protein HY060_16805, partial [Proteobacteria bacterium]|nr:hypothetical protein [Pseudomonadota bacterium]